MWLFNMTHSIPPTKQNTIGEIIHFISFKHDSLLFSLPVHIAFFTKKKKLIHNWLTNISRYTYEYVFQILANVNSFVCLRFVVSTSPHPGVIFFFLKKYRSTFIVWVEPRVASMAAAAPCCFCCPKNWLSYAYSSRLKCPSMNLNFPPPRLPKCSHRHVD